VPATLDGSTDLFSPLKNSKLTFSIALSRLLPVSPRQPHTPPRESLSFSKREREGGRAERNVTESGFGLGEESVQ